MTKKTEVSPLLLASHSHQQLWWYLRCSYREDRDISDTCDQIYLCPLCLHPWSHLYFFFLTLTNAHTHKHGDVALFGQQAASKLRCAHGRAGTWKTKANMQTCIRLEHITRFTQPCRSCSEKPNVEWNRLMCTAHPKNVKPDVNAPTNIEALNYTMMNKEECNVWSIPVV